MVKRRHEIISEDELKSHPVMQDIKDAEKNGHLFKQDKLKKTSLKSSIIEIIKKWGVVAVIILIVLLYAASRLRLWENCIKNI